jgi:hypothetical protein
MEALDEENDSDVCARSLGRAGPVCAVDETGQWYLTPQAGYFWTDNERNVDDDWLYGLTFGKRMSDNWSIELNLNNRGPTPAAESSSWIDGAGVGLVCRSSRISPWWAASRNSLAAAFA